MTTIAASLPAMMMAADSACTMDGPQPLTYATAKLIRTADHIVGAAGDTKDISRFIEWLHGRRKSRPRILCEFEALVLTRAALHHYLNSEPPDVVKDGVMAAGSGATFALASLTTQLQLGLLPDPRIAVRVACLHDAGSKEPIDFLRWKKERARADAKASR